MPNSKNSLLKTALICLSVGAVAGWAIATSSKLNPEAPRDGIKKLQDLAEGDIADYYRLQNLEERYKKADEVLGKIMIILLADIGLKLSPEAKASMQANSPTQQTKSNEPESPAKNRDNTAVPISTHGSLVDAAAPKSTASQTTGSFAPPTLKRRALDELRGDKDFEEFLKASKIENFEEALKTSVGFSIKSNQLQELNGHFTGTADVISQRRPKKWDIELKLNGRLEDGKLKGDFSIIMSANGTVFSNKSGSGSLDGDIRELPSDPQAILLEAAPGIYLQAFFVNRRDLIIANIIERDGMSAPFKTVGKMVLTRQ